MDVHEELRGFWDRDAESYDRSPAHSLSDPVEAAAWRAVLARNLPAPPASVLDVGAGTGAISLILAELGHRVTALDISARMLARARQKAESRGLHLATVVAPATEPPPGPFDAVVERHVLWTTPDPVAALEAWRKAAPGVRLLLLEGRFGSGGVGDWARTHAAEALRRALGIPHEHHGSYSAELLAALPLLGAAGPGPLIAAALRAGWRAPRIERLRDVEWARRTAAPPVLGWLESVSRHAIVADG